MTKIIVKKVNSEASKLVFQEYLATLATISLDTYEKPDTSELNEYHGGMFGAYVQAKQENLDPATVLIESHQKWYPNYPTNNSFFGV